MTLEQVGSLAEVLGAIATLATLLYLARQIRQNTVAVRSSAAATYVQNMNEISSLLAADPDLCDLYFRGLDQPELLTEAERRRFLIVLGNYLMHLQQAFQMESEGILHRDLTLNSTAQIEWLACRPGVQAWVDEWGGMVTDQFRERLREAMVRGEARGRLGESSSSPDDPQQT